jgi:uncharacterized protein (TIGR03437 family)
VVAVAIVNGAIARAVFATRVTAQGISIPVAPTDSQALSTFSGLPEADVLNLAVPYLFVVDREGLIREDHAFDAGSGPASYWDDAETNMRGSFQMWLGNGGPVEPGPAEPPEPAEPQAPSLPRNSIVDAASFTPVNDPGGAPAPGSIVSIFGSGFTDRLVVADSTPLPTSLNGVSVTVGGTPLPLFFVSEGQINAQLPYLNAAAALAGAAQNEALSAMVTNSAGSSEQRELVLAPASPSIFTFNQSGGGQGIVVFVNTATLAAPLGLTPDSRPARPGEALTVFANGLGDVTPPIGLGVNSCDPDGVCSPDFSNLVLRHAALRPSVEIGGVVVNDQDLIFAGLAPEFVALFQLNLIVPEGVPSGNAVPIVIRQNGASSREVTIAIEAPPMPPPPPSGR